MTRYGGDGPVTDMLNMSYIGNVLAGVTHNGVTKLYSHDVGGRLTEDGRTGVSVSYDVTGMPLRTRASAQTSPGTEAVHSYLSDGTRLGVSMTLGTGHLQVRSGYENYGSLTFREIGGQQSFESSLFGGGVILSDGVRYFTRDYLGNTRVVTDGSGSVVERDDYYPFGERHEDSSMPTTATNRWRFAGKEIQPLGSTGWLDFGARQYDSFLGRWTTVDPLAEKYPGFSPYLYCAGNPVNYVDPDGMANWRVVMKGVKMAAVGAGGIAGYGAVSSTGIGAFFGAVGLVDSMSSLGMGVAYAITGLMLDADDDKGILDAPESLTNAVAKSLDKIVGTGDQKIEGAMNVLMGLTEWQKAKKIISSFDFDTAMSAILFVYQEFSGGKQLCNSYLNEDGK